MQTVWRCKQSISGSILRLACTCRPMCFTQ